MSSSSASAATTAVGAAIDVDANGNEEDDALPTIQSIWENEYCNKSGDGVEKPLKKIWEDAHIQKNRNDNSWTCLWCGKTMKPAHAKRAQSHVLKKDYRGVDSCSAVIPEADLLRYQDLWDR